jgi:hypothetical protein
MACRPAAAARLVARGAPRRTLEMKMMMMMTMTMTMTMMMMMAICLDPKFLDG